MPTSRHRRNEEEPQPQFVGTPATVPNAMGDDPNVVENLTIEPTHEDIARRAYHLYEERGSEHGRDLEDWFQAERELRQFLHEAVGKFLKAEGHYAAA
jgi:hypothetical protein